MRARLIAIACAAALFAGAIFSQRQANSARAFESGDELLYLPNARLLKHFTGGMNHIVADLLWLQCIQYIGKESKGDRKFTWLQQMLETVVHLDPWFDDAYRYGGMFLAALRADDDAGIDLLERGFIANPDNFQLPYELAMIFLLNRKDEPGAKERATYYLSLAAAIEGSPEFIRNLATQLHGQYDLADVEREMWARLAGSEDTLLRELAARKLVQMDIVTATEQLNQAVLAFRERTGEFPASLDEMVQAGIIQPLGPDPLGGRFFLADDGVIYNTTTLEELKANRLKILRNLLDGYEKDNGHWPASLDDLVRAGKIPALPAHPYPGQDWNYNPATGIVE